MMLILSSFFLLAGINTIINMVSLGDLVSCIINFFGAQERCISGMKCARKVTFGRFVPV